MTTGPKRVRKFFPDIRLAKLVHQSGGKLRDDAVADAESRVESLRDESIDGIEAALREAEAILRAPQDGVLSRDKLIQVQELADRVITLSGTFGYAQLDKVARSLGDLTNMLLTSGEAPVGPVLVHVHTAWLFAPRAAALPEEGARKVLAELGKVLEHFGARPEPSARAIDKDD